MSKCPNISSPQWKDLVSRVGETKAWLLWFNNKSNYPSEDQIQGVVKSRGENTVNYTFKAVPKILKNLSKINGWANQIKDKDQFYAKVQKDLQIPKDQIELIREQEGDSFTDKVTNFLASHSFAVKTEISQDKSATNEFDLRQQYQLLESQNHAMTKELTEDQFVQREMSKIFPTNHYSSMTVSGGANYTENRIVTPEIEPSIKGHPQFAENNDIGWFRSDEKAVTNVSDETEYIVSADGQDIEIGAYASLEEARKVAEENSDPEVTFKVIPSRNHTLVGSKTRRILEFQSDFFQKGRNMNNLVSDSATKIGKKYFDTLFGLEFTILDRIKGDHGGYSSDENMYMPSSPDGTVIRYEDGSTKTLYGEDIYDLLYRSIDNKVMKKEMENKSDFLGLLMKDNNWVTFFIKSIAQDSAKKGYEKVLFPRGDTAAKVEGHQTLEDLKRSIQEDIDILRSSKDIHEMSLRINSRDLLVKGSPTEVTNMHEFQGTHTDTYEDYIPDPGGYLIVDKEGNKYIEYGETGEYAKILANGKQEFISSDEMPKHEDRQEIPQPDIETTRTYLENKLKYLDKHGFGELKPIHTFYEKNVSNVLRKQFGKNNIKIVKDEHGNEWNEVKITSEMKDESIQFQRDSSAEPISKEEFDWQRKQISSDLNADIVFDESMDEVASVEKSGDRNKITINPNRIFADTLVHEYGHIFIDGVGGLSNPMIQSGIRQLKGTRLERDIREEYSDRSETVIQKEILATAIGLEGKDIFAAKGKNAAAKFMKWLDLFWNRVKGVFGLQQNVAKELARRIINDSGNAVFSVSDIYNYKIKNVPLKDLKNIIAKTANSLEIQINKYASILEEGTEEQQLANKSMIELHKELRTALEAWTDNSARKAVTDFISKASQRLQSVESRLDKIEKADKDGFLDVEPEQLIQIKQFISTYKGLGEILNSIRTDPVFAEHYDALKEEADKAISSYDTIDKRYSDLSKKYMISILSQSRNNPTFIRYRDKFISQFDQKHKNTGFLSSTRLNGKKVSSKDYQAERGRYVNDKLERISEQIEKEEQERLREIVETLPNDIGVPDMFYDSANINDDFIQFATEILQRQHDVYKSETIKREQDFYKAWEEFKKDHPQADMKKMYDALIDDELDMDGKPTGRKIPYLSGQYNASYYENLSKLSKDVRDTKRELENDPTNEALEKKHSDAVKSKSEWLSANSKKVPGLNYIPQDKWLNKKDLSESEAKLRDMLIKSRENAQNNYKVESAKLDVTFNNAVFRKLPAVNRTGYERTIEEKGNPVAIAKNWFDERWNIRSDDVDYQDSHTGIAVGDEDNKLIKSQPVFFRKDAREQSYDLMSIHLIDETASIDYSTKRRILPTLEIMRDISADRDVAITHNVFKRGLKKMKNIYSNKDDRSDLVMKGVDSRQYKVLSSLIDARLYGIKKYEGSKLSKIMDSLIQLSSMSIMTFNYFSAVPNALVGRLSHLIESRDISSISKTSGKDADIEYWKDYGAIAADVGRLRPLSKTNLLGEYFNPTGSFHGPNARFAKSNRGANIFDRGLSYSFSTIGEHYVHSGIMIAGLMDQKLLTKDGKYIDKDGNPTDKVSKGVSLYEYIGTEKDGLVFGNEKFKNAYKTTFSNKPLGKELYSDISYYIRDVAMSTQGNYASDTWSFVDGYSAFRAFISLRGWLINGFEKRWRGFSYLNETDEDGRVLYSRTRGDARSGNYVDAIRFTKSIGKNIRKLQFDAMKADWNELSSRERGNVRKTVTELTMMATLAGSAYILSHLSGKEDEEEVPDSVLFAIFVLKRTQAELAFYAHPGDTMRILRSPAASLSMLEKAYDVVAQVSSDAINFEIEKYERGELKGKPKIQKRVYDILPGFAQLNREVEKALSYLENPTIK